MLQAISTYFHNHGRRKKAKTHISYVRRWSLNQVVGHERKAELEVLCRAAAPGHLPGSRGYLKKYQKVLTEFVETLPAEDKNRYTQMAQEWSDRCPPVEVQQKWVR